MENKGEQSRTKYRTSVFLNSFSDRIIMPNYYFTGDTQHFIVTWNNLIRHLVPGVSYALPFPVYYPIKTLFYISKCF